MLQRAQTMSQSDNPLPKREVRSPGQHYAIILAAGASSRMGRCKTTLPWLGGQTLLSYQIEQFLLAGISPIVVLATEQDQQPNVLRQAQTVINPFPQRGKTSSLLQGLDWVPANFASLTISAVDQPRASWIYQTLLQAHLTSTSPITAPSYQRRMGHPLVFAKTLMPQLKTLSENTLGLRQVVKAHDAMTQRVEFSTPEVLLDLNTPEDYERALNS